LIDELAGFSEIGASGIQIGGIGSLGLSRSVGTIVMAGTCAAWFEDDVR
jgi:hypothetical protein